jgi:hypothetical protein
MNVFKIESGKFAGSHFYIEQITDVVPLGPKKVRVNLTNGHNYHLEEEDTWRLLRVLGTEPSK